MTAAEPVERSSVTFETSAKWVIQPRVKVVAGVTDPALLDDAVVGALARWHCGSCGVDLAVA